MARPVRIALGLLVAIVLLMAAAFGGWWLHGERNAPSNHLVVKSAASVLLLVQTDDRLAGTSCSVGGGAEVHIIGDDTANKGIVFVQQDSGVDTMTSCPKGSVYRYTLDGLSLVSTVPTVTPHPAATQTAIAYCGLVQNAANRKFCGK